LTFVFEGKRGDARSSALAPDHLQRSLQGRPGSCRRRSCTRCALNREAVNSRIAAKPPTTPASAASLAARQRDPQARPIEDEDGRVTGTRTPLGTGLGDRFRGLRGASRTFELEVSQRDERALATGKTRREAHLLRPAELAQILHGKEVLGPTDAAHRVLSVGPDPFTRNAGWPHGNHSFESSLWDSSGTHVVSLQNKNPRFTGVLGADDGTRTHDLLHGKCARCSRPFAPVRSIRSFAGSSSERPNATAPERTPNLAILATSSPGMTHAVAGYVADARTEPDGDLRS
jgi:hypothetical protein